jgi:hypothetical protein
MPALAMQFRTIRARVSRDRMAPAAISALLKKRATLFLLACQGAFHHIPDDADGDRPAENGGKLHEHLR